ncbi:MAG: hypothetical protein MRJ96_11895 [Nitrospirales bacterium]|nr:hypothetical protein [Nitrospira sp.]MDR4502143.1 hypothetical protein [Nitrospirales bacterium]
MATLTVKNIPEPLVQKLKDQAALHRRSLNHEVIRCLEQAAECVPLDPKSLIARARDIRQVPKKTRLTDHRLLKLKSEGRP